MLQINIKDNFVVLTSVSKSVTLQSTRKQLPVDIFYGIVQNILRASNTSFVDKEHNDFRFESKAPSTLYAEKVDGLEYILAARDEDDFDDLMRDGTDVLSENLVDFVKSI